MWKFKRKFLTVHCLKSDIFHECEHALSIICLCELMLQDIEVTSPPDDSISCLAFSPPTIPGNFLIGGSWANDVSCLNSGDSGIYY